MASDSSGPTPSAEEIYAAFLASTPPGEDGNLEALCAQHPDHATALRRLAAAEGKIEGLLEVLRPGVRPLNFFGRGQSHRGREPAGGARQGDVIGDYRLVRLIGSGGQGRVWEAEELSLQRRVALKLVHPSRIDPHHAELFAREARAGGRLAHRGIVTVYASGQSGDVHWIAQELVEGAWTLRDFIDSMRSEEELPKNYYRDVAGFMAKLADALEAAHGAGVIHRDVKPQNVLITPNDEPKLTDFGLARITDETALSVTGEFAGTYLYMSPEQVAARRMGIDHRTDVFSLGVVLYEMLALHCPFEGDTTHQIAEKIVTWDPPDLHKLRSRIPVELAVICGKAMEKARGDRYATMGEFAADLRRHLANEPIQARPPGPVRRAHKWVIRNPTKSVASTVAAIAFLVISGLLVVNVSTSHKLERNLKLLRIQENTTHEALEIARQERDRALRAEEQAKRRVYSAFLSAAQAALEAGAFSDALRLHARCSEPYRNWEWHHLGLSIDQSHRGGILINSTTPKMWGLAGLRERFHRVGRGPRPVPW